MEKNWKLNVSTEYWTHAKTKEEAIEITLLKLKDDVEKSVISGVDCFDWDVTEIDEEGEEING